MAIDPDELQEFYDEKKGPREHLNMLEHGNRPVAAFWLRKTKVSFSDRRVWPVVVVLAILFVLAVNLMSGGALRFLTDWPNCLVTAVVIGLAVFLIHLRRKSNSFSAEEIESIAEQARKEKQEQETSEKE